MNRDELAKQRDRNLRELAQWFSNRRKTLGLAESCTGGLLSSWISSQPGVSSFFRGAVVSYSGEVKASVLGVPHYAIESYGEVSIPVAQFMARGAAQALGADWALSITGIAGPSGGSKEKPVGTVCFALYGPGVEKRVQKYFDGKERTEVQFQSAFYGLELLLATLNE